MLNATVVDATGDGDVAYRAGEEMMVGREEDGRHMPVSLVFALANADVERALAFKSEQREAWEATIREAAAEGGRARRIYTITSGGGEGGMFFSGAMRCPKCRIVQMTQAVYEAKGLKRPVPASTEDAEGADAAASAAEQALSGESTPAPVDMPVQVNSPPSIGSPVDSGGCATSSPSSVRR